MFPLAVKGQEEIGDEAGKDLHHQSVFAPGKKMIDMEMPLPPAKEGFDAPAELVHQGDLLGGQVETVGGNPVGNFFNLIANQPDRLVGLVDAGNRAVSKGRCTTVV